MHTEACRFMLFCRDSFPEWFQHKTVLDMGSGDINGNNRSLFDQCEYTGNDVIEAPNVTLVCRTKDLDFPDGYFHTIVSTECLEHDPEYLLSLRNACRMLSPGGLLALTCASTNRAEHGTRRSGDRDSYGTVGNIEDMRDYYKNLTIDDIKECVDLDHVFQAWRSYYHPGSCDLYFWGIKRPDNHSLRHHVVSYPEAIETGKNLEG